MPSATIGGVPHPGTPLEKLGFLTIGLFDPADPAAGHETTLQVVELGERLGFDSAWLRHRHLQFGISSPVAVLAAATQRTSRIELGTAVIPLGWENPLRLAEDRPEGVVEEWSDRVEPHSPGLRVRTWYGGASLRSAQWAGENGLNLLTSSVVRSEEARYPADVAFAAIQADQIRRFRAAHPGGAAARVSQGLVVIPTDSATAAQQAKYAAYVEARTPRTASPQGPARMVFARDLLGTSEQIAEQLYAHAGFREVREVVFALPFSFEHEDYVQILTDIAERLGPALGWHPAV